MLEKLPPRERQIVDVLYVKGEASVAEVCAALPVALSTQAVRAMLARLEGKGYAKRRRVDAGYVYAPAVPEDKAKRSALHQIVKVFFNGSPASAASALLGMAEVGDAELNELERLVAEARKGRSK